MRGDIVAEHFFAFGRLQVDDLHAALAQPVDAALESARLAHDHGADLELHHEAAAVPAGRERRHHDGAGVATLAPGLAERVGLAVHGRVTFLHAAVVPRA